MLAALLLGVLPPSVCGQTIDGVRPPTDPRWGTLTVPATMSAVAEAADITPPDWERVRFLRELTRVVHFQERPEIGREMLKRLTTLADLYSALAQKPGMKLTIEAHAADDSVSTTILRILGIRMVRRNGSQQAVLEANDDAVGMRPILAANGHDPVAVADAVNRGGAVTLTAVSFDVPLPLSLADWKTRVLNAPQLRDERVFAATVGSFRASMLYYGLVSVDAETLAFITSERGLLERIRDRAAGTFARHGRSIRVRNGHVVPPGGPAATELWERFAGARTDKPAEFVTALLTRDGGRLAALHDAITHLDPSRAAFALTTWQPNESQRRRSWDATYAAFLQQPALDWNIELRPFLSPSFDPGTVLRHVAVDSFGRPRGPSSKRFWEWVFDSDAISARSPELEVPTDPRDIVDAGWLLNEVMDGAGGGISTRIESFYFSQRVWPELHPNQLGDAAVALRGFLRYPTLLPLLERMGVRTPSLYASLVRRAALLTERSDDNDDDVPLMQFQATLVVLDRLRSVRAVSATVVERWLETLAAFDLDGRGRYGIPLGLWLADEVLPTLRSVVTAPEDIASDDSLDRVLLRGMAGVSSNPSPPEFEFEGFNYRLDFAQPRLRRLVGVRERQRGNSLDAVIELCLAIRLLSSPGTDLDRVTEGRTILATAAQRLQQPAPQTNSPNGNVPAIGTSLTRAQDGLASIQSARDMGAAVEAAERLKPIAEYLLSRVLRSIAYAPYIGEPGSTLLLNGDVAQRHDLGLLLSRGRARQDFMWTQPTVMAENTEWHVTGSIVGLDLALAYLAMPQTSHGTPPEVPRMRLDDRDALLRTLAITNPFELSDADGHAIAAAIRRGRDAPDPDAPTGPLSRWILNARAWARTHEPDAVRSLKSVAEAYWLGRGGVEGSALNGWGAAGRSATGCWCMHLKVDQPWETLSPEHPGSEIVAYTPDLMFRLAEVLTELKVPTTIAAEIMPRAVQDVIDHAQLGDRGDWTSLLRYIQSIDRQRVEDYVSTLTAGGALVPHLEAAR